MDSPARYHLLVVDDEKAIRRFLRAAVASQGWAVDEAATGSQALALAMSGRYDAIVLDLMLPDMDGTDMVRHIRTWSQVPIVIVSAREQEHEKIEALDAGADDYVTKPFGIGELLARLRANIRRATRRASEPQIVTGGLLIDIAHRTVTRDGQALSLTPIEYDVLRILAENIGKVLTHRQILTNVWGPGYGDETHLLQVNVSNLRRKIEPDPIRPEYLITEPGVGYRLREHD